MFFKNRLTEKRILSELKNKCFNVISKSTVTSTNTVLKELAAKGAKGNTVIVASKQTAGRGRLGRTFYSPGSTGIYMSILIRPGKEVNPLHITTDAAVCCARVIERMCGEKAHIKWVNDIYVRGRKVCGILTESSFDNEAYAVLGIGVNVFQPKKGFPDEIQDRAGALFEKKEKHLREKVISGILDEFYGISHSSDHKEILEEYKKRSIVLGKEITVLRNGTEEKATAVSVGDDYSLLVCMADGREEKLTSGDVSIKI